jgi:Predicted EndoIII-related endonuclease
MPQSRDRLVRTLLQTYGRTYAEEAGIRLTDKPGPLFQLIVLTMLLSKPISSDLAVAAARELFASGYRTPQSILDASWQDRVDALGRGHYRRYDESTSTLLAKASQHCLDRWRGDLRRMRAEAHGDRQRLQAFLTEFPGIGPIGADIFIREVQAIWPEYRPSVDAKVLDGARALHLPPTAITTLARPEDVPRLTSALVRVGRARRLPEDIRAAVAR